MACKKLDIRDYFRLTPTMESQHENTDSSAGTSETANSRFKPVIPVSIPNYRYYSAELGRWLSRDPIEEEGGVNLYAMVGNDSVDGWDYLGLRCCTEAEMLECIAGFHRAMRNAYILAYELSKYNPVLDGIGGFPKSGGVLTGPGDHYKEMQHAINGIIKGIKQLAKCHDCDCFPPRYKIPKDVQYKMRKPIPKPIIPKIPIPQVPVPDSSPDWGFWARVGVGTVATVLVVGTIVEDVATGGGEV